MWGLFDKSSPLPLKMSVKSVSLNDVVVGDSATHIVIYRDDGSYVKGNVEAVNYSRLKDKVDDLMTLVEALSKRILRMELASASASASDDSSASNVAVKTKLPMSPYFGANIAPEPTGLKVRRLSDLCDDSKTMFKDIVNSLVPATKIVNIYPMPPIDLVEDVEEVEEVEDVEEDEEEEEEEEEVVEMQEFEYKGVTYYKDSENLVYKIDDDGDLDDTAIGVWSEEKKKVLKYKQ